MTYWPWSADFRKEKMGYRSIRRTGSTTSGIDRYRHNTIHPFLRFKAILSICMTPVRLTLCTSSEANGKYICFVFFLPFYRQRTNHHCSGPGKNKFYSLVCLARLFTWPFSALHQRAPQSKYTLFDTHRRWTISCAIPVGFVFSATLILFLWILFATVTKDNRKRISGLKYCRLNGLQRLSLRQRLLSVLVSEKSGGGHPGISSRI